MTLLVLVGSTSTNLTTAFWSTGEYLTVTSSLSGLDSGSMSAVASTKALSGKYPGTVGDVTLLNLLSLSS